MPVRGPKPLSTCSLPPPRLLATLYHSLLDLWGGQGWWPLHDLACRTGNAYHPREPLLSPDAGQRFEIAVGALLTQNTSWRQVEGVLPRLVAEGWMVPEVLEQVDPQVLSPVLRPVGYHRQKALRLRLLAGSWRRLQGAVPTREQLLAWEGIGPETADSILLYAFHQPVMVIDAYTRRVGRRLWGGGCDHYACWQAAWTRALEAEENPLTAFLEAHALLVVLGKQFCSARPRCGTCPLRVGLCPGVEER